MQTSGLGDDTDDQDDHEEFSRLVRDAGWSIREVARRLGTAESTPRQWVSKRKRMPPQILPWMRRVVGGIQQAGAPDGWRFGHGDSD